MLTQDMKHFLTVHKAHLMSLKNALSVQSSLQIHKKRHSENFFMNQESLIRQISSAIITLLDPLTQKAAYYTIVRETFINNIATFKEFLQREENAILNVIEDRSLRDTIKTLIAEYCAFELSDCNDNLLTLSFLHYNLHNKFSELHIINIQPGFKMLDKGTITGMISSINRLINNLNGILEHLDKGSFEIKTLIEYYALFNDKNAKDGKWKLMGLVPVDFFKKLSANDIEIGFAEYQTTHVLASDLAADTAADTLPLISVSTFPDNEEMARGFDDGDFDSLMRSLGVPPFCVTEPVEAVVNEDWLHSGPNPVMQEPANQECVNDERANDQLNSTGELPAFFIDQYIAQYIDSLFDPSVEAIVPPANPEHSSEQHLPLSLDLSPQAPSTENPNVLLDDSVYPLSVASPYHFFSLSHNRAIETLREIEKTPNEGIGKHSNSDAIDAI